MPGKTLPVTLKIRNAGSESVSQIGYKVTMQSADQTEKVLVEEEKDVTITAGETVPVVVNVPIPENISSRKLKLQIWEMKDGEKVAELSDDNNSAEITVGLTDLAVSENLYTTQKESCLKKISIRQVKHWNCLRLHRVMVNSPDGSVTGKKQKTTRFLMMIRSFMLFSGRISKMPGSVIFRQAVITERK